MRLLVIVLIIAGCAKPARKRWTDQLSSVGQRLVAVATSGAIKVDANAAVQAAARTPPAQRVREDPPPQRENPPPITQQQQPPPDVTITRVDAARPTVFVLRGQTQAGKSFCEQHATQDACTSACTAMLRPNMLRKPEPSSPTSCACTEQDTGC